MFVVSHAAVPGRHPRILECRGKVQSSADIFFGPSTGPRALLCTLPLSIEISCTLDIAIESSARLYPTTCATTTRRQRAFGSRTGNLALVTLVYHMTCPFLDTPIRTLVISTDPAHSLGDALDQDISGGEPVRVMGLDNLSAMEVSLPPFFF